jgi:hypothetical protein
MNLGLEVRGARELWPPAARDFKKMRPVPANSKVGPRAKLQEKSGFFVVKKVKAIIFIEKSYGFWVFSLK